VTVSISFQSYQLPELPAFARVGNRAPVARTSGATGRRRAKVVRRAESKPASLFAAVAKHPRPRCLPRTAGTHGSFGNFGNSI